MKLLHLSRILGLAALVLSLSGCFVTSDRPLSNPKDAKADPLLIGEWRSTKDKDPTVGRIRFDVHGWGFMDERQPNGRWKIAKAEDRFFITQTAKGSYLNLRYSSDADKKSPVRSPQYQFLRYRVSPDHRTLTLWAPKLKVFQQAVLRGALTGKIDRSNGGLSTDLSHDPAQDAVMLHDSSGAILQFIESRPVAEVFEVSNVYERIK